MAQGYEEDKDEGLSCYKVRVALGADVTHVWCVEQSTKEPLPETLPPGLEESAQQSLNMSQVFIGNLAPDVSSDAVENVVKKCGEVDRVIMKRGTLTNPQDTCFYFLCLHYV